MTVRSYSQFDYTKHNQHVEMNGTREIGSVSFFLRTDDNILRIELTTYQAKNLKELLTILGVE